MILVKYEHLLGRPHVWGSTDCFGLARDFYKDNWGIEITDYARAEGWHKSGHQLINEHLEEEGFKVVNEPIRLIRPGDGLLLAIGAPFPTHIGVYLGRDDNGQDLVLDHQQGKTSRTKPFSGIFRNNLCAQVRHPAVVVPEYTEEKQLIDYLSPHKRAEIEKIQKQHERH